MNMNKYTFSALLLAGILLAGVVGTKLYLVINGQNHTGTQEEYVVVTSFYPMYIATENIIGDTEGVRLENLSEPQTGCLHDYQLTTADMQLLSTADVLIINGGGAENFLDDVLKAFPELCVIDASEGLESHGEGDKVEGDLSGNTQDDVTHNHNEHNHDEMAHIWMCPADYKEQVHHIAEELGELLPEDKGTLLSNALAYNEQVEELGLEIQQIRSRMEESSDTISGTVILLHEAFTPLCEELGLKVLFTMDLDEERQISSGEVAEAVSEIKNYPQTLILAEMQYGQEMAQVLQNETGAEVVYLSTLSKGELRRDSYIEGMAKNIQLLKEALLP